MSRIAITLALAVGVACAAFGYEPQRHNDTFTTNGITYAQRGGLGSEDYVVTDVDISIPPPVDLPQKWALANVTNANGGAVSAGDVGALRAFDYSDGHGWRRVFISTNNYSLPNGDRVVYDPSLVYSNRAEPYDTISIYGPSGIEQYGFQKVGGNWRETSYAHIFSGSIAYGFGVEYHDYDNNTSTFVMLPPNANGYFALESSVAAAATAATNYTDTAIGAALSAANAYTDAAIADLPPPAETDPRFREWVGGVTNEQGIISAAESAMFAYTLGSPASEVAYSAEDITAISNGFYIGEQTLYAILTNKADKADISSTNQTFSNAVLAVGLNIDTNSVAVLNEIASTFGGFPIEGTATTVGGLLAALAAAVAALKRTKADASALRYAMPESVALVAQNDAATLVCGDRAVTNATIVTGFSTLNLSFPAAVSGYVRDFYLRITVAAGESAPALSLPQGVTIENAGGAVPVIADGEASAAATTLVWFSETAPGVFTAKSETVKAVV